ncbi:flagellin [Clostridium estertheticum]|uniref:flagellin n=1 Tax=Clostridium estertheticum TaxID=238834 RepID=UPI00124EE08F|nr:flagellin [Clostridium estertheticum]MBU3170194.1 flagellin [Clostridium estertheticum]MBZ9617027.1 flagellin [Clostridium estertheticum subsp. laramiense]WAG72727.1 flagellin [Clostridium estertheticum]
MRISKNMASMNIYRAYSKNLTKQSSSLERISSGIKINSAKDDPNAIAQSERFRMQIRGMQMAANNTQDGVSMLQTAEGGLEGITSGLQRVRELLVQSGGATTDVDKGVIQKEIDQMLGGANDIANNTEFNGVKLLSDKMSNDNKGSVVIEMVTGANVGEKIDIPKYNLTTEGLKLSNVHVNDIGGSLNLIDDALNTVIGARSKFGALENRFQSTYDSITEISDKTQEAESGIRDTDMAEEMMKYSKYNILIEAGNAMMLQSNQLPQNALKILENVRSR